MSTIPSTLGRIQTYAQDTLTYVQNNLKIDQSTQDKAYAVALNVMKVIAFVAASATILAVSCKAGCISTILPGAAPIIAGLLALSILCKSDSTTPSKPQADSAARAKEWSKEARSDRESAIKNAADAKKKIEIENTSTAWHNGNNSNFAAVGTRKV